jgi:hypothetical protein
MRVTEMLKGGNGNTLVLGKVKENAGEITSGTKRTLGTLGALGCERLQASGGGRRGSCRSGGSISE